MRAAPAVSCAKCAKRCAHEHTGSAGASRPSLRSGFTAYFVLSPVNGSFATVAAWTPPRDLTPAPRRQDHTTSPYAQATLVSRSSRVHRIPPRVRDDREPPLVTGETGEVVALICPTGPAQYFFEVGWTGFADLPDGSIGRMRAAALPELRAGHCKPALRQSE